MEPIRVDRSGEVAELVLDAPPLNLFGGAAMRAALVACLDELEREPPRALLVRAEGDVFSAGVAVTEFAGLDHRTAPAFVTEALGYLQRVDALPFPTVALVHGLCLTAGFELALACDLIWAAEPAKFGLVEAAIGITPLGGGTQRLAERAGLSRARELVYGQGLYDAERLHDWGVVNRVLPVEDLLPKGRAFAARLAAGPTRAHAATKRISRIAVELGVAAADRCTPAEAAPVFSTEDFDHGLATFQEKGPGHATFTGA